MGIFLLFKTQNELPVSWCCVTFYVWLRIRRMDFLLTSTRSALLWKLNGLCCCFGVWLVWSLVYLLQKGQDCQSLGIRRVWADQSEDSIREGSLKETGAKETAFQTEAEHSPAALDSKRKRMRFLSTGNGKWPCIYIALFQCTDHSKCFTILGVQYLA